MQAFPLELISCVITSNKRTAYEWLMSDVNLKKLVRAEAECIAAYLGVKPAPVEKDYRYRVRVTIKDLHIRSGPGTIYASKGYIKPGVYRIKSGKGIWLGLYSGAGWLSSKYAKSWQNKRKIPAFANVIKIKNLDFTDK